MNWKTFVPAQPVVIQNKWYMNYRSFSGGEHVAGNLEVDTGDASLVSIPDGVYSFRLFSVAETTVEFDLGSRDSPVTLTLRSDPLDSGPVYFVKERVKVIGIQEIKSNYSPEDVDGLVETMAIQGTKVALELPGKVFMPIVNDITFIDLG